MKLSTLGASGLLALSLHTGAALAAAPNVGISVTTPRPVEVSVLASSRRTAPGLVFLTPTSAAPEASHGTEIDRAPVVAITDNFIGLEGQKVVDVDQISHDEILNIQQLEDSLRDLKKREEFVHQMDKEHQFSGKINIQSDKKTHFKIIKRVMYSCAMAGYGNINFAVLAGKADKGGAAGAPAAAPAN